MNSDSVFAFFYMSVISVALFGSIYSSRLNAWNTVVFKFSSEMQKIVENTTVVMDIRWRWLRDTFEMTVSINDDNDVGEFPYSDILGVLFDSDNNGVLLVKNEYDGYFEASSSFKTSDDHCAYITPNGSESIAEVVGKAFVDKVEYPNLSRFYFSAPVGAQLNESYYIYSEDRGYEFFLSIPIETINVTSPTLIHLSFYDCGGETRKWGPYGNALEVTYYIVSAEFEV